MKSTPHRGCLITIEGADGMGKTTQLAIQSSRLMAEGRRVATFDFPKKSETPIGKLIGGFLQGRYGQVTPEFLALAFSADRLVARAEIVGELDSGSIVLCDRYVASNIAFQGSKLLDDLRREELNELLRWLEYDVYRLPRPDLEIVLTANDAHYIEGSHLARGEDAHRAYAAGAADIHEASQDLQLRVNAYYRHLPESAALRRIAIEDTAGERLSRNDLACLVSNAVQRILERKALMAEDHGACNEA